MKRLGLTALLAVLGLALAIALPLAGGSAAAKGKGKKGGKAKTERVKVADDFFAPPTLKIKKGTKVKYKWDGNNTNSHNVTLTKGPKGVKKKDFTSATGSIGIKFNPKFKKPGTYQFVCTLHATVMQQTVKVKNSKKKKHKK